MSDWQNQEISKYVDTFSDRYQLRIRTKGVAEIKTGIVVVSLYSPEYCSLSIGGEDVMVGHSSSIFDKVVWYLGKGKRGSVIQVNNKLVRLTPEMGYLYPLTSG